MGKVKEFIASGDTEFEAWKCSMSPREEYRHQCNDEDNKLIQGTKADAGKAPMELLSGIALLACAKVLAFGAKKYASHNWRKGLGHARVSGAILRHLFAYLGGEDTDPESGLPHVDHILCGSMFLAELVRTRPDLDDRYKKETR